TAATIPKLSGVLDMRPLAVIPTHGAWAYARLVYLPVESLRWRTEPTPCACGAHVRRQRTWPLMAASSRVRTSRGAPVCLSNRHGHLHFCSRSDNIGLISTGYLSPDRRLLRG